MPIDRKRLLNLLKIKNWTPYQLAKFIKVHNSTIYRILYGEIKNPGIHITKQIAKALDVQIDDLLR